MSRCRGRRLIGLFVALGGTFLLLPIGTASAQNNSAVVQVENVGSCADLAAQVGATTSWRGLRLETPRDGVFSDRHMSVELSDFSASGFAWSSDTGLDAVLVGYEDEAGASQLAYFYDPESVEDTKIDVAEYFSGGVLTQLRFCHDVSAAASDSTTTTSTTVATTTTTTAVTTTSTTAATTTSTTTADAEAADELARTGADSIVLFPLGLVLVGLGVAMVVPFQRRRENHYRS